jgi:hypothetical protein
MRTVLVAAVSLCLAAPAAAGSKRPKPRSVNGTVVLSGPAFEAKPIVEVSGLRFYDCKIARTGDPCTVITGYVVSHLPHEQFDVQLTFHMQRIVKRTERIFAEGPGAVRIERVQPERKVPFKIVAPPGAPIGPDSGNMVSTYKIAVAVFPHTVKPHKTSPDLTEHGRALVVPSELRGDRSSHPR